MPKPLKIKINRLRVLQLTGCFLILAPLFSFKPATTYDLTPITVEQKMFWNPLFMRFNEKSNASVYEVVKDKLFVGTSAELQTRDPLLTIKGEGAQILGTFRLKENFDSGDQFMIDLATYGIALSENKLYELEIMGAFRKKLYAYVRKVPPITKQEPLTTIAYNALTIDCETESGSVVDYYGHINDGIPPFHYMWLVYRDSRENYLYQPVVGKMPNMAEVPGVTVDLPLGYTVVFAVRDACGNYVEKYVNMQCGDDENYGNTIFLQSTPNTITDPNLNNSN